MVRPTSSNLYCKWTLPEFHDKNNKVSPLILGFLHKRIGEKVRFARRNGFVDQQCHDSDTEPLTPPLAKINFRSSVSILNEDSTVSLVPESTGCNGELSSSSSSEATRRLWKLYLATLA